jgi:hypothetical protein
METKVKKDQGQVITPDDRAGLAGSAGEGHVKKERKMR